MTTAALPVFAQDHQGRSNPLVNPVAADEGLRNPWPEDWEKEFQARGERILKAQSAGKMPGGNTYFENEKRSYGLLMAHALAGDSAAALRRLQQEDAQAKQWHRETEGIDYYACFTLKHQVRKYFYFGGMLDPAYKRRMFEGAKTWTQQDPLWRPHYAFRGGGPGWGPDVKNSWVDVRSTENLFLMRVTSVYLMAEETGNEATREKYKRTILNYTKALYRVGMGEWDSENYHGHSIGPLLNLYDFAKDRQVKLAAKAALDFVFATGAVKYFRGGFNGPTKRDYNHTQPFGGSAASMLWVYFGDCPVEEHAWESDEVHALTSGYRPPPAVVNLARKRFERPVEILAAKAHYEASVHHQLDRGPAHLETQYIGRTFQMGSLVGGTSAGKTDVNGFKIMCFDSERGVADLQCVPGPDPLFAGSAKYTEGKISGENRVAQNRNLAVWLAADGRSPWVWLVPERVGVEVHGGVTFLKAEKTWVAVHAVGLETPVKVDEELAAKVQQRAAGYQVLSGRGRGGGFCGLAIEVREDVAFDDFRAQTRDRARVESTDLSRGRCGFIGSDGRRVELGFDENASKTLVLKDGKPHDLAAHGSWLFGGDDSPIRHAWHGGVLTVKAGGAAFRCTVDDEGGVRFENR
jgi:hypothetical protein